MPHYNPGLVPVSALALGLFVQETGTANVCVIKLQSKLLDKQILEDIVSGERRRVNDVFRHLYQKHYQGILKFITSNRGSENDATDTFQNALLILYDQIRRSKFKGNSSVKTYLFAICKNLWLKELAKKHHENSSLEQMPLLVADGQGAEEKINFSTKKLTLSYLLEQLDESCREVLTDFYFRGLSIKEIATKYSLTNEDSAKNKKYRCMKRLMDLVKSKNIDMSDINMGH